MPTPGADLSRLNLTQLITLTGRDRRWIASRFADLGLAPVDATKREKWYAARSALEAIYRTGDDADLDITNERARLAKEQADAQALKNAVARDEQVTGDEVDEYLYRLVSAFTQRIRAIPPKAAPEVRATGTDAEGEALLTAFHDEALTELADAGRRAADRLARRASREVGSELRRSRVDSPPSAAGDGERVGGPGEDALAGVKRRAGPVEDEPG